MQTNIRTIFCHKTIFTICVGRLGMTLRLVPQEQRARHQPPLHWSRLHLTYRRHPESASVSPSKRQEKTHVFAFSSPAKYKLVRRIGMNFPVTRFDERLIQPQYLTENVNILSKYFGYASRKHLASLTVTRIPFELVQGKGKSKKKLDYKFTVIYRLEAHYIIEAHPLVRGSSRLPETFYEMKIGQFSRELQPFF